MRDSEYSSLPRLLVIGGATATGKTAWAIRLAQLLDTEIISADSRQFYRGMRIGTAAPTLEEQAAAPHHFVQHLDVTTTYSVGDFERDALATLERIFKSRQTAILVGGSGLYIRAVCEGLDEFPQISQSVRESVASGETQGGLRWLQEMVAQHDPAYFQEVDRQNPARLRRALEVSLASGAPYSSFRGAGASKPVRPFQTQYLLLDMPRVDLYQRIDDRVDTMMAAGLENEARQLLPYRHLPALKTVGYEELFDYFDGKTSREDAISKIKQHSRNFAKRQSTWFRKYGQWTAFHPAAEQEILNHLNNHSNQVLHYANKTTFKHLAT